MTPIQISIKDYRAVKSAEIDLNGITVISGINGSGKSSISRLLYYAIKYANDFESIVDNSLKPELNRIDRLIQSSTTGIRRGVATIDIWNYYKTATESNDFDEKIESYSAALKALKEYVIRHEHTTDQNTVNILNRLRNIIEESVLNKKQSGNTSLSELIDDVIKILSEIKRLADNISANRDYNLYINNLTGILEDDLKNVRITEYGVPLLGKGAANVPILNYIQQVVYIDTPMIVGMSRNMGYPHMEYWRDLNEVLEKPAKKSYSVKLNNTIKDIIKGGSYYDDEPSFKGNLKYKRNDGLIIDLIDSATGIKSFSLLQTLLRNGTISSNTLLIIDEPEAHLHPQWIVEYARIIVMMHQKIGAKFFIASHSTDFVSAIKYIAEKQKVQKSLSFYLAEEDKRKPYSYKYKSIGTDIEPIFESFNKSLDKISEYGGW